MADDFPFSLGSGAFGRAWEYASNKFMPYFQAVTAKPSVVGFENNSVNATTAESLNGGSIPSGATHALLAVDTGGGDLRFREDATNPTASVGLLVPAGQAVELTNLANVRVISTTGTTVYNCSFRRYDQ
jgi:hypothetical protein